MNTFKYIRYLALALSMILLLAAPATAEEAASAQDAILPAPNQATEIPQKPAPGSGVLRVLLQSLDNPVALGITTMGDYALEGDSGFRFQSASTLTVACANDTLYMSIGGLTIDMGPSMTLTRHEADGESGLYIHGSQRDNLYVGDLQLSAVNGAIQPILHIGVEEYLYGVVPYEMSDSFPIEALKAQAVAARTYALGRQFSSASRAYDLVDTTNDQVFFGFDPDCENAIAAVDATKGIVGVYKGNYASCYYSASNGGQTALPNHIWGYEGDYGYLDIRDDPYDLENSASIVKSMEISANGSYLNSELKSLLKAGVAEELALMGYSDDANDYDILQIVDIEPVEPRFSDGSRLYDKLRFTMKIAARHWDEVEVPVPTPEPAGGAESEPAQTDGSAAEGGDAPQGESPTDRPPETKTQLVLGEKLEIDAALTADLSVFEHFKRKFDMKISVADCELATVTKVYPPAQETQAPDDGAQGDEHQDIIGPPTTDAAARMAPTSFIVELRRFGHGVGMSQRGAQTMAGSHGFTWREILSFYYPNMDIVDMNYEAPKVTSLNELPTSFGAARPRPTPKPTPKPLRALNENERYAKAALASKSSTLNVRETPVDGRILAVLGHEQRMIVMGDVVDGWVRIATSEVEGYVSADYIAFE